MADPDKPYNFKPDAVPTIRDEATGHVLFDADTELVRETWILESPVRVPTLRRVWCEWRCGRRHAHGPDGFYLPVAIKTSDGWACWMQECQACGRFTCWSERSDHAGE